MSTSNAAQGALIGAALKQFPLIDDVQVKEVSHIDSHFIPDGLALLQNLHGQMEPIVAVKNLPEVRLKMHAFLGKSGFIGARALHQVCRNEIYPFLHEGRWPVEPTWFSELGVLLRLTLEAFEKEYQLWPSVVSQLKCRDITPPSAHSARRDEAT